MFCTVYYSFIRESYVLLVTRRRSSKDIYLSGWGRTIHLVSYIGLYTYMYRQVPGYAPSYSMPDTHCQRT
jgi:hypothetical protein